MVVGIGGHRARHDYVREGARGKCLDVDFVRCPVRRDRRPRSTGNGAASFFCRAAERQRQFRDAYGRGPDAAAVLDAIATYERSLVTPGSRFDRWLAGEADAITPEELSGYQVFKSLGCITCHQGVNVGGNLFQRHGIFHPLASPKPELLRVPSLRNVATTAPYFHDGSAATLDEAVRKMGLAQLNSVLTDEQVKALVAYLGTLTGNFRDKPVGTSP